ncbi:unnamed protein product [Moneuplotes crassus]|uniref:Peptidase C1A papain C-terminal domain-containing protein n=1 Tax=Euplotes crassus TaxID=5936 RepID=A0AAD2D0G6_EUPCR|nr:unnamed protein product [Moneuplotes crassus]|eukprot:CAMPEP_0196994164 /NCGR_PEP_ID=MMETSP1380-20130617/401_1 /TAXON_ID=5936 /ORGANISM="Euplotes crassus, Strain CT5" /LENGTH=305 /DNA_ID=CAMNT_0042409459 /DNA_START=11 /DNA_END=928 /DNA_ORIENTATION=-
MKFVILAVLLVSTVFAYQSYAPGEGPFAHLTQEEFAAKYLMAINDFDGLEAPYFDEAAFEKEMGVNSHYDMREAVPQCVSEIRDQAGCGGCWAFAITSTISDRECIEYGKSGTTLYSPQHLIDCEDYRFGASGCQGADTQAAFGYTDVKQGGGLRLDTCYPYQSGTTGKANSCKSDKCTALDEEVRVFSSKNTHLWNDYDNVAMAKEIQEHGTIYMSMQVYDGFMNYKSGVYIIQKGERSLGGHAIRIIGWGKDETAGYYWIAANQWNTGFGEDGYFRIGFNQYIGYKAGAADFAGEIDSFVEFH